MKERHVLCLTRYVGRLVISAAVLIAANAEAKSAAVLENIRHGVRDDRTRVVLDFSSRSKYEIYAVDKPDRVAINLPRVRLARGVKPFDIPDGVVRRVRINRLSWGSQVVLDLRGKASWRDFHLAAVENMPHRVVVDVTAAGAATHAPAPSRTAAKASARSVAASRPFVVAIDAGHGGSDPGAIGRKRVIEKNEALHIARKVAREIDTRRGHRAVLVRDSDVFLSLPSRQQIARRKGADIFVSIHLNSAPKKSARGAEVYFLSPAGAEAIASRFLRNKNSAAKELGVQGASSEDVLHMLVDVNQQSMMQRSSLLAEEILDALDRPGLPPARSVKQKSFAVLKSITMPSVMVEAAFLTNSQDAAILRSKGGKDKIADAIADGVVSYLRKYPPAKDETGRVLVHTVRKGDTLWKISRRYKTSVASIQKSNKLGKSKTIRVGQELVIREGHGTY